MPIFYVNLQLECESSSLSMPTTPQQDSSIKPYDVEFGGDVASPANMSDEVQSMRTQSPFTCKFPAVSMFIYFVVVWTLGCLHNT